MTAASRLVGTFKSFKLGLNARADSEHEQALIRILIAAIVWVYLRLTYSDSAPNAHHQYLILWFLGLDVAFCALLFGHILRYRAVNRVRRFVGMVNDAGMCTLVMFLTGEAGAAMIGLYLFITFGNGFRYGRAYLFACQALCLVGYTAVLLLHDHWQLHQTVGWSLMIALVVLPLYVSTLLKRIEQARARAEEANKAKSTFLANMSHEMRTPLNGIVGAIELFRTTPLDARQTELTRLLQHSVGMLRALVDDVLDIEKIEAGRLTIEIADFDLHGALNGLINLLRPHARNKGLTLSALVDPAIDYRLCGDSHHLTQILLNLVSNAIKFTEAGSVEVSVTMKSETATGFILRFEVRDSGIGISPEAQARIFDRFVQADDSTTRRFGGTGLGTTIAKQLVELMSGKIGVTSVVGRGSTFWFEIPLLRSAAGDVEVVDQQASLAVVIASESDQPRILHMVTSVCADFRMIQPDQDVPAFIDRLRAEGRHIAAVFYSGELSNAQSMFNDLSQNARNASTALIYITSGSNYLRAADALRDIDGVNLVERDAPPRHLRNAIHAATSKGSSLGQVIDLKTVLEEQRQRLRILVAEDNITNQQIIRELLEKAGHDVVLASDGEIALDLYESSAPEIAILDFNMPERNGLEVTKAVRAMEATGTRLPIMILSASVTTEARERAKRAGADEFLGKPYDAAVLLQTIDRMARRSRTSQRTAEHRDRTSGATVGEVRSIGGKVAPLIDLRRLQEVQRIAADSDFMSRLIAGFEEDIARLLENAAILADRGELAQLSDVTHAMKGAALGIGAARFATQCVELEQLAAEGQLAAVRAVLAKLQGCFGETSAQLRQHQTIAAQTAIR